MNEQTLGEKRVKTDFNITDSDIISQLKNKTAELINLVESLRDKDSTGEKHRVLSIAQTEYETACMYAVKAVFTT